MLKRLPIGIDNFAELVAAENYYSFADKTLFIKEIIDEGSKLILITRPRRWGKTLNMSMLNYFLAAEVWGKKTEGMFDPYAIAQVEGGRYINEHQGRYPVIYVSFKDIKEIDFAMALDKLKNLFKSVYRQHEYLMQSEQLSEANKAVFYKYLTDDPNPSELEDALRTLSELLHKHSGEQVYILVDEYDTPLNADYGRYFDQITAFMKNLFSAALKDNSALKKGVMTGILRISKDSMLSGLNHLKVYTVLKKGYKSYFGFTDADLDHLFAEQGLSKDEERVKAWYNGYQIDGLTLYNPWSIINCLSEEGELRPYWVNTADDSLLREILYGASIEIKNKLQQLLEGLTIEGMVSDTLRYEDIKSDETSIWSLLLYTGYLKVISWVPDELFYACQLAVPNQEVLALYKGTFKEWLRQPGKRQQLLSLLTPLFEGKINEFAKGLSDFLLVAASIHDYAKQPEAFYHGFMLALTAGLLNDYYIASNQESGLGRPDLLFISKDSAQTQAIILEFKHVGKKDKPQQIAKAALAQINTQVYAAKIKQHAYIKQVLKVGIAFDGKQVYIESEQSD